jgi:hypothetical protein
MSIASNNSEGCRMNSAWLAFLRPPLLPLFIARTLLDGGGEGPRVVGLNMATLAKQNGMVAPRLVVPRSPSPDTGLSRHQHCEKARSSKGTVAVVYRANLSEGDADKTVVPSERNHRGRVWTFLDRREGKTRRHR